MRVVEAAALGHFFEAEVSRQTSLFITLDVSMSGFLAAHPRVSKFEAPFIIV